MLPLKTSIIAMTAALLLSFPVMAEQGTDELSINQLKNRLKEIDAEVVRLPHCSMRSGVGSVGFRSEVCPD